MKKQIIARLVVFGIFGIPGLLMAKNNITTDNTISGYWYSSYFSVANEMCGGGPGGWQALESSLLNKHIGNLNAGQSLFCSTQGMRIGILSQTQGRKSANGANQGFDSKNPVNGFIDSTQLGKGEYWLYLPSGVERAQLFQDIAKQAIQKGYTSDETFLQKATDNLECIKDFQGLSENEFRIKHHLKKFESYDEYCRGKELEIQNYIRSIFGQGEYAQSQDDPIKKSIEGKKVTISGRVSNVDYKQEKVENPDDPAYPLVMPKQIKGAVIVISSIELPNFSAATSNSLQQIKEDTPTTKPVASIINYNGSNYAPPLLVAKINSDFTQRISDIDPDADLQTNIKKMEALRSDFESTKKLFGTNLDNKKLKVIEALINDEISMLYGKQDLGSLFDSNWQED